MKRNIMISLQNWLKSSNRKPLIIRGARQVGKTWLARHLAKTENKALIELNFEREPRLFSLFDTNDPKQNLKNIEQHLGTIIHPANTLLFLDEIQRAPEMLAKLRWFAEELPELAVIAAGSLLDFVLADHSFSMPVGRVSYMYIEPLSFEEFLSAIGQERLVNFLTHYTIGESFPSLIHEQLMTYVKEYTLVGGLPAVVNTWASTQTLALAHEMQHEVITAYRDDFAKYRNRLPIERLEDIWNATPKMLGKQWKYRQINPEAQSVSLKQALKLLSLARICHPIYACTGDGLPLAAGIHEKIMKVLFFDIGLVSSALGLLSYRKIDSDFSLINEGGLAEQFVGQGLRTSFPHYIDPKIYYWAREQTGASAEIDYLIQHQHQIIPIEVKAGKTGQLRSLHLLMGMRRWSKAVRFNADLPSVTPVSVKNGLGDQTDYTLLSLPFYLINQLDRLLVKNVEEKPISSS